jgi:hypothetical protein
MSEIDNMTDLDVLDKFQDVVEELTTNELEEAWKILVSRRKALDSERIRNFSKGEKVYFYKKNGERVDGEVEKVMRTRLKVRVWEDKEHIRSFTHEGKTMHLGRGRSVVWTVNAGWVRSSGKQGDGVV